MLRPEPIFWCTSVALLAALLFGGGTRQELASNVVPQLAAIPLLIIALPYVWGVAQRSPLLWSAIFFMCLLPIFQVFPLPASVWTKLPGQQPVVEVYQAAGLDLGWRSWSLIPDVTLRSFFSLLSPLAILLGVSLLGARSRELLVMLLVMVAVVSVFLAIGQIIYGGRLYFYEVTNTGRGVGFFANANHFTTFLCVSAPLAVAVLSRPQYKLPVSGAVLSAFAGTVIILGLALTGSRSALIFGVPTLVFGALTFRHFYADELPRHRFLVSLSIALGVLLPIALGMGLMITLGRLKDLDLADDLRLHMATVAWSMIKSYFPMGGGIGTLPYVYPTYEGDRLVPQFINRAHNDVLEALYESGVFAAAAAALFLAWLVLRSRRVLREGVWSQGRVAGAAALGLWVTLIHSLWDYPLRTAALNAVLALLCGLLASYGSIEVEWKLLKIRKSKRRSHRRSLSLSSR